MMAELGWALLIPTLVVLILAYCDLRSVRRRAKTELQFARDEIRQLRLSVMSYLRCVTTQLNLRRMVK